MPEVSNAEAAAGAKAGELVLVEVKPVYQSKTFWLNTITALIAILSLTEFADAIPDGGTKYVLLAIAILNIIMRVYFTNEPVAFTKAK